MFGGKHFYPEQKKTFGMLFSFLSLTNSLQAISATQRVCDWLRGRFLKPNYYGGI